MRIELTLKNYRCFPDSSPARIVIEDGEWTAFLGVNNSGKSSLLRFFYEFRPLFAHLASLKGWIALARDDAVCVGYGSNVRDAAEVFHNQNDRSLSIEFRISSSGFSPAAPARNPTVVTFEFYRTHPQYVRLAQLLYDGRKPFPAGAGANGRDKSVLYHGDVGVDLALYLDAMARLQNTLYVGAFRNVLNTGAKSDYFDIEVGDAFINRWRAMQTGNTVKENEACEEVAAAIERLFGYGRLTIQAAASNDTLQLTIDRRPFKLHELGAGLAQFILVLVNAAVRRPEYILIDEPELNLHPSLQLDFLSTLGRFATNGLLFATHSVGLARAAADHIYAVRRKAPWVSEVTLWEANRNLPELLGALSYSGYQAVGFDKVLLVEGTTEVRTIQQFLRMLRKDHQVLLLPMGGSTFISAGREVELNELKRITSSLHCLIDSEKVSEGAPLASDREAFCKTCAELGIDFYVLERRSMENYLADSAIKQVKGAKYRQLGPYEDLRSVDPAWGKHENWKIAGEMCWDDIKDTDLGVYLARL